MGYSHEYEAVLDWQQGQYSARSIVKYQGNIFYAKRSTNQEPGGNDWQHYDELYDLTSTTISGQAKIIAYIPTWRKGEGFDYGNDEIYQYITHGIISFLQFSETNLGEFTPESVDQVNAVLSDIVTTGQRNSTKISIALGGAGDNGFQTLMSTIGNNPDHQLLETAVQNVVNFVTDNELDGVDLDLECWENGGRPSNDPDPAGSALTFFAQKLKELMPSKLVSAAVFVTPWYGNNYDPEIVNHLDWLGIMTYDLTGSWNDSPVGPHSNLFKIYGEDTADIRERDLYQESYLDEQQGEWLAGGPANNPISSVEDSIWYWTNPFFTNYQGEGQQVPRNKIAAGVPIYGYDFAYGKEPAGASGYKTITYKDILDQFPEANEIPNANMKVSGSTPRPPFINAQGNYQFKHNIYFETPDTAVDKLNFLKSVGTQGVIIWELSQDFWEEDGKSIIKALYQNSGNLAKRQPLTPKLGGLRPEIMGKKNNEKKVSNPVVAKIVNIYQRLQYFIKSALSKDSISNS